MTGPDCATCHQPLSHSDQSMGCIRCKPCRIKRPGKLEGISRRTPKPKAPVTDRYPERKDQPSPPRESWWLGLTPTEFATAAKGRASR